MNVKLFVLLTAMVFGTIYVTGKSESPPTYTASPAGSATGPTGLAPTTEEQILEFTFPDSPESSVDLKVGTKSVTKLILPASQVVYINGAIMENAASIVAELKAKAKSNKVVWLLIDSPGGSVIDGAAIVSAMEGSTAKVNTVCLSICASMAFIIHQYGNKRYALDRSILMAHPASGSVAGTMEQMKARLDILTRYVDKLDVLITKRVNMPFTSFKSLIVSEFWTDAEDGIKTHYVDGLVDVTTDARPPIIQVMERYTGNRQGTRELKTSMKFMWGGEEALAN
jgi:ATP-dependent Clp protease protease subunit